MTSRRASLARSAAIHLLLYAADMGCAVAGFIFGFGLQVQSWPALIGFMVLIRWIVFCARGIFQMQRDDAAQGDQHG